MHPEGVDSGREDKDKSRLADEVCALKISAFQWCESDGHSVETILGFAFGSVVWGAALLRLGSSRGLQLLGRPRCAVSLWRSGRCGPGGPLCAVVPQYDRPGRGGGLNDGGLFGSQSGSWLVQHRGAASAEAFLLRGSGRGQVSLQGEMEPDSFFVRNHSCSCECVHGA